MAVKLFPAHSPTLIDPGHTWVTSGSDPDYYPGQWVIWVSDADAISTLIQKLGYLKLMAKQLIMFNEFVNSRDLFFFCLYNGLLVFFGF